MKKIKTVMTLSGHDPTGGAGIQADAEAIKAMGSHAVSVITCLTNQDTKHVYSIQPLDPVDILNQAKTLLNDMNIAVFKLGLLGSIEIVEAIHTLLLDNPDIPVVFDPVLASGGGKALSNHDLIKAIQNLLLPHVDILTPNTMEAKQLAFLSKSDSIKMNECVKVLLAKGVKYVFVTGTHANTQAVKNILYTKNKQNQSFLWQRLPYEYHGSGCTLAAAIAGAMTAENDLSKILIKAQQYTWDSLTNARKIGKAQYIPQR